MALCPSECQALGSVTRVLRSAGIAPSAVSRVSGDGFAALTSTRAPVGARKATCSEGHLAFVAATRTYAVPSLASTAAPAPSLLPAASQTSTIKPGGTTSSFADFQLI